MRLAVIVSSLAGGGAERAVSEMVNYWAQRSWSITIITWTAAGDREAFSVDSAVQRIYLGVARDSAGWLSNVANNLRRILRLRRVVRELGPDIVLSFMDSSNVTTLLATRWLAVPVVVAERSDPAVNVTTRPVWRALRRLTYGWADSVVAQTAAAADWIADRCNVRCEVVPNALRQLPDVDSTVPREQMVLSVGRLAQEKDVGTLFRAFAIAHRTHPSWRLEVVGDGPLRHELQALAVTLGIEKWTVFHGFARRPEMWMARASLFVLSSQFEGFPNSLLEAMAMGATVVSSDCRSGPRELISDGVNGRLFRPGDVNGLAAILNELMGAPERRHALGREGRRVRDTFAAAKIMPQWERILREVVEAGP